MSKSGTIRQSFDVLSLSRQQRPPVPVDKSIADFLLNQDSRLSPIRSLLEKRSDWAFADRIIDELRSTGLSDDQAMQSASTLLGHPSVAALSQRHDRGVRALFLAVSTPFEDDLSTVAISRVTIDVAQKPPQVTDFDLQVQVLDLSSASDLAQSAELMEAAQRDYGIPILSPRPPGEPESLTWIGDPRGLYRDVPAGWEAAVRGVGIVLGIDISVVTKPEQVTAQALDQKTVGLIVPTGTDRSRWIGPIELFERQDSSRFLVGEPGSTFAELISQMRVDLIDHLLMLETFDPSKVRDLGIGERIYHRKVGSGRKFDLFDDGRNTPCVHGEEGFEKWGEAPKARKGMQRRYSNFQDGELYHCGKYPDCGMYMAEGPRK